MKCHYFINARIMESKVKNIEDEIEDAIEEGNISLVGELLGESSCDYNYYMALASTHGSLEIVLLMLSKGANDYYWAMENASSSGHIDIVKLMLKHEKNLGASLMLAASSNHMDIVVLLLENQAKLSDFGLEYSIMGANLDITILLLSLVKTPNYDRLIGMTLDKEVRDFLQTVKEGKIKL